MGFDDHVRTTAAAFFRAAGGEPITYRPEDNPANDRNFNALIERDAPGSDDTRPAGMERMVAHMLVDSDPLKGIDAYKTTDVILAPRRQGDPGNETWAFHQFLGKDTGMWQLEFTL